MYCKNRISDNLWAGKTNEEDEGEGKMLKIMHKIDRRKAAAVLVILLVMILSVTVFSKAASDPENHAETIEALDEKKEDVLKLTATSAAAATALAAIPGDATTPVANKMADLSSYFLIILMVVFLEKYLVTLTGYAAFTLLIVGICVNRTFLQVLALKIAAFGLVIFLIIPISMNVSAMIEETYDLSVEETMEEAEGITEEIDESTDSEGNIVEKALSKIKDGAEGLLKKGETLLNHFIETIAVMLVTSCLIPIIVLVFMSWFVKMLFGVKISAPKDMSKRIATKFPGYKKEVSGKLS